MPLPLPPRAARGEQRQRRAWLVPQIVILMLLVFLAERLLLQLPPELGARVGGQIGQLRLHAVDGLWRPWQLWSGPLILHDWWQLLLALPVWLIWAPAIERRLGSWRLLLAMFLGLPLTALMCLYPQALQPVSLLPGAEGLLLGMALGCWGADRSDALLLRPALRAIQLHRVRLPVAVPVVILILAEGLRLLLLDGMLQWPAPLLGLAQLMVSVALGMLAAQLLQPRPARLSS